MLIVGWVTLGYFSDLRPLWYMLGVAAIMSVAAVLSMFHISPRISGHGRRDSDT
jgi:membrane protein YdbS with pleckstrin-like domain